MTEIHIVAGLLALLAGFVALYARKGRALHRKSGLVFVGAMIVMLGLAAVMALFVVSKPGNGIAALLTLYLVITSLLTVKRRRPSSSAWSASWPRPRISGCWHGARYRGCSDSGATSGA